MLRLRLALLVATTAALVACSKAPRPDTVTLSTGVQLAELTACEERAQPAQSLDLKKNRDAYTVRVHDVMSCDALEAPWMTVTRNKKASLVLQSKRRWFGSGCECSRSATIRIQGHVDAGDTLYVVNDDEVLGHFSVP